MGLEDQIKKVDPVIQQTYNTSIKIQTPFHIEKYKQLKYKLPFILKNTNN